MSDPRARTAQVAKSILATSLATQFSTPVEKDYLGVRGRDIGMSGSADRHTQIDSSRRFDPLVAESLKPQNGQSYLVGDRSVPLRYISLPRLLADAVDRHGGRDAAVFCESGVTLSYYDLARKVDDLAAGLLALGLAKGDRIGIWSPNREEWLLTQFATARIGLVLVNINPAYRLSELEYALNKVACKALISAARFKSSNYLQMLGELAPELAECEPGRLQSKRLPSLRTVIYLAEVDSAQPGAQPYAQPGAHSVNPSGSQAGNAQATVYGGMHAFDDIMQLAGPAQRARLDDISATLVPDEAINIQFTSGTTGAPKGATLSHFNIVNNGRFCARAMHFSEHDRLCIPVPLYHCFGMVMGVIGCVSHGACMVFPGQAFDANNTLSALEKEQCTALYGVPTMFQAMLASEQFAGVDLSRLRTGIMAGAPCPVDVMREVMAKMHMHDVTIAYGMTETSPVSFQSAVDDPVDKRVATVGRIHPHVEVKIVDEQGMTTAIGEKGELWTRGYSVMAGYWGEDQRTAETTGVGGWMKTGDLATIDADGYCQIVGRLKDMIVRGGENVYPRELEEFLRQHPAVQDVQVFGVPDPKLGEAICAWIVLEQGAAIDEAQLQQHCRGQIAHYKVPRYVRFVPGIPMTVTGKPQKFVMRDKMIAELGLAR